MRITVKRILSVVLVMLMLLSVFAIQSCGGSDDDKTPPKPKNVPLTRVTVELTSIVEFMVGQDGKVASVTALNDEGGILIAGESFLGKTPEQAIELTVNLASKIGYIVKDSEDNVIKISVFGKSEYATSLAKTLLNKAFKAADNRGIYAEVKNESTTSEHSLRDAVSTSCGVSADKLAGESGEQLCKLLMEERVATASLVSYDLRQLYYKIRDNVLDYTRMSAQANVINSMGSAHSDTYTAFKSLADAYKNALQQYDEQRYGLYASPDSEYQKAFKELMEAKLEMIKKRNELYSAKNDTEQYAEKLSAYQTSIALYNTANEKLALTSVAADETLYFKSIEIKQIQNQITALTQSFSDAIKTEMTSKAEQIQAGVNSAKTEFWKEFEKVHGSDIAAIKNNLVTVKQQ